MIGFIISGMVGVFVIAFVGSAIAGIFAGLYKVGQEDARQLLGEDKK